MEQPMEGEQDSGKGWRNYSGSARDEQDVLYANMVNPATEDNTEWIDISKLLSAQGDQKILVMAGTDHGVVTMSETVAMSIPKIRVHLNQFHVLSDHPDNADQATQTSSSLSPKDSLRQMKIPKSNKLTAGKFNDVSHTQALAAKRQELLREEKKKLARQAHQQLSEAGKVLQRATTLQEVENAQQTRRQTRQSLREFESSSSLIKGRHTQRLRTKRSRHKLGAAERRYIMRQADADYVTNMPRPESYDDLLQETLARFRALLKPPAATFTEQLPADVESNPTLIAVVLILFEDYLGIRSDEDTPLTRVFNRVLAKDFISVMKNERPDVIYSLITGDYT
ncbi:hypothetical protein BGZ65_001866 [Modicella reniformis]|uniref:Uncharacterized protein n=1 Tax=Modicella reniformis TaxID=1440133 RepID=A0A9P6J1K5_9FUNG|nr:hypothetical protein BGZ65_001866 [Modicella reniformis]